MHQVLPPSPADEDSSILQMKKQVKVIKWVALSGYKIEFENA